MTTRLVILAQLTMPTTNAYADTCNVTVEKYSGIQPDMTLEQVQRVMGCWGEQFAAQSESFGRVTKMWTFGNIWRNDGVVFAWFLDGKLLSKAIFGSERR